MNLSKRDLERLKSDVQTSGFASVPNSIDGRLLEALRAESAHRRIDARRVTCDGDISYRGFLADLGDVARAHLTGLTMSGFLRSVFAKQFALTDGSSCYTYFEAGDFLSAHMDGADDCEVTVLVYLDAESPDPDAPGSGLKLQIYEDRGGQPGEPLHAIKTRSGTVIAGRGSCTWHGRPPLQAGEHVHLLTACFASRT